MKDASYPKKAKIVGILGGMGPYASCAFLRLLLDKTPVSRDSDHLHVVLDSNPHIPSRTRAALYGEESPLEGMADACSRLSAYPVDVIALPCNSAAAWLDSLKTRIAIPILDIIEITSKNLPEVSAICAPMSIAVWGGWVTYYRQTYRRFIEGRGHIYFQHGKDVQKQIESFIHEIKLNNLNDALYAEINELGEHFLNEAKVACIILGCTEFGCLAPDIFKFPCLNSLSLYAEYIVDYAES